MLRHAREMGIDREPSVWVEQLLQQRTYLANLYRKRDLHPKRTLQTRTSTAFSPNTISGASA